MTAPLSRRVLLRYVGAAAAAPLLPTSGFGPKAFARTGAPLLLGGDAIGRARAALAAHPAGPEVLKRVLKRAEELSTLPPAERQFEPGRAVMLPTSREILERVQTFGAARFLTGDRRFDARAVNEILAACDQPDWNPKHFLDTAEMAHAVALGLDWFGAAMGPAERGRAVAALIAKGIEPGLKEHAQRAFWTTATHNWNVVCNGGMAIAALALGADAPDASARMLALSLDSVRGGFSAYAPDGGCIEGPAYWDYGTRYAVYLIAALESAGADDRGLARSPGFAECGRFFLHATGPTGLLFNYADSAETIRRSAHRFWLAQRFGRPAEAGDELARKGSLRAMHALWFPERAAAPAETAEPLDARFRGVDVAMFRSAWGDAKAMYLACKGGDNAANHAQLDLGTFVLDALGERFALDLGPDDYALPGYFEKSGKRFTYLRNASAGHNVLLMNGANQRLAAKAALVTYRSTPGDACAVADLDSVYPGLKHRRGFALIERAWAVVADEAAPDAAAELQWQMHTRAEAGLQGAVAVLKRGAAALHAHIVEPAGAIFAVEPAGAAPPQNPNQGVSRLVIRFPDRAKPLRVAVAFGAGALPPAVARRARMPLDRWAGT